MTFGPTGRPVTAQGNALGEGYQQLFALKGHFMPQSLSSILVHLVFSTKNRVAFIRPTIEGEMYPYLATTFRNAGCPTLAINGTEDHIHILFSLARTKSIADIVEEVKTASSRWIKSKGVIYRDFHWQAGYGAFSIGRSQVETVRRYINRQKEHHRRRSFQDEFRLLLTKYEVPFDEKYVWD
jgi:putative transposase